MMWTVTSFWWCGRWLPFLEMHAAASVAFNRSIIFPFLSFPFAVMLGLVCSLDERSVTRLAPKDVLYVKMRVQRTPVMIQLDQGWVHRERLIATECFVILWPSVLRSKQNLYFVTLKANPGIPNLLFRPITRGFISLISGNRFPQYGGQFFRILGINSKGRDPGMGLL